MTLIVQLPSCITTTHHPEHSETMVEGPVSFRDPDWQMQSWRGMHQAACAAFAAYPFMEGYVESSEPNIQGEPEEQTFSAAAASQLGQGGANGQLPKEAMPGEDRCREATGWVDACQKQLRQLRGRTLGAALEHWIFLLELNELLNNLEVKLSNETLL